jgi:hypothetical protein
LISAIGPPLEFELKAMTGILEREVDYLLPTREPVAKKSCRSCAKVSNFE